MALLIVMWLGESFCNAFLFMNGVDGGLTEGGVLASACSAINIAFGLAAGLFGLRLVRHRKTLAKLTGAGWLVVTVVAGLLWNFKVAHFREALEHGASAASFIDTLPLLPSAAWFHFSGIQSVMLLWLA